MDCYVAICPGCKHAVGASVIMGNNRESSKDVAKWVRRGLNIETKPVEWVRENLHQCTCKESPDA